MSNSDSAEARSYISDNVDQLEQEINAFERRNADYIAEKAIALWKLKDLVSSLFPSNDGIKAMLLHGMDEEYKLLEKYAKDAFHKVRRLRISHAEIKNY